jgi:hypothetical protein
MQLAVLENICEISLYVIVGAGIYDENWRNVNINLILICKYILTVCAALAIHPYK